MRTNQDPRSPENNPNEVTPKLPQGDQPNDSPHPQPDPGNQPIS